MTTYRKIIISFLFLFFIATAVCFSTPEFAGRTGKTCAFCHDGGNGGPLNHVGIGFVRNGYDYPIPERILEKSIVLSGSFHKTLRLLVGIIHIITISVLVGTIFYIHIIVTPRNLKGGVPLGEKRLGLICMSIIGATGVYLTWYRIDSFASFFESRFGVLLFIKIMLFIIMVVLGILAVTVITRKMRKLLKEGPGGASERKKIPGPPDHAPSRSTENGKAPLIPSHAEGFDLADLPKFDGKDGRPAYILYKNKVYDVTESHKWKDGSHFRAHTSGEDLTDNIANAPHGEEVLEKFPVIAELTGAQVDSFPVEKKPAGVRKLYISLAYVNLVLVFLILICVGGWLWGFNVKKPPVSRNVSARVGWELFGADEREAACIECHFNEHPGIAADWSRSMHAKVGVSCIDCHKSIDEQATWVSRDHFQYSQVAVSGMVSPKGCSICHHDEVEQYQKSKHANTLHIINTIDKWLIHGMNNEVERSVGCYACHGTTVVFTAGKAEEGSWPNVGVGRKNPDGSLGSCTSCHTRHNFSVVEARKPEACDQCHLGPDHPQIEIYNESKHGTIYHAEGDSWNWRPEDFTWTAGDDYRAPTCASCHMSEAPGVKKSHDVTRRLSWELQAPFTIRPSEFKAFPASTDWREERNTMKAVCLQCHSGEWVDGHFDNMDNVVQLYNEDYYRPVAEMMDELYQEGLLTRDSYFDEELEWEFYELWHHEGRRARMGTAMMAPDYAWWHGFYEVKHRFLTLMDAMEEHTTADAGEWRGQFPGRHR